MLLFLALLRVGGLQPLTGLGPPGLGVLKRPRHPPSASATTAPSLPAGARERPERLSGGGEGARPVHAGHPGVGLRLGLSPAQGRSEVPRSWRSCSALRGHGRSPGGESALVRTPRPCSPLDGLRRQRPLRGLACHLPHPRPPEEPRGRGAGQIQRALSPGGGGVCALVVPSGFLIMEGLTHPTPQCGPFLPPSPRPWGG